MAGAGRQPHNTTPKRKRSSLAPGGGGVQTEAPSGLAMASPPSAPAAASLTVADAEALDCGVCFLPLKPPIFQCDVGHVLCSACSDKLKGAGKCHVCGVATPAGGYRRCHAMERVVEGIRSACPNAPYGCAATPPYYGREEHIRACPHAPCHCPGEACGFVGSTAGLLEHFRTAHGWPCVDAKANYCKFDVCLRDGFNFVAADCPTERCLLLLNVVRQPLGRAISVLCIDPHAAAGGGGEGPAASNEMECRLWYSCCPFVKNHRGSYQTPLHHYQASTFSVARTDLSNGMPNPDGCFQFVLPDSVIGDHDKNGIEVTVGIW